MAKTGRPRALDETKRREICALITAGGSLQQAANYVGCSQRTIHREAKKIKEFGQQLQRAHATAQLAPLQSMRQAAQTHWRAAAWMLERSDPENFGRKHRHHFGSQQLKALKRDLLAVFAEEIHSSALRDRVVKRVTAVLNYAMRHAWDTQRCGSQLRQAMEYFDRRNSSQPQITGDDPWGAIDALLDELSPMPSTLLADKSRRVTKTMP